MYKVFIDNKEVVITTKSSNDKVVKVKKAKKMLDDFALEKWVRKNSEEDSFILTTKNPDKMFDKLFAKYKWIRASGGVVVNEKDEYLFIKRLGKWDLPKGKKENGETSEETAVREVQEECNLKNVKLKDYLTSTYHTFTNQSGIQCIKLTDWYNMRYEGRRNGSPQEKEGITKIAWLGKKEWSKVYNNTWAMIADLLKNIE